MEVASRSVRMRRLDVRKSLACTLLLALMLLVVTVGSAQAIGDAGHGKTLFSRCAVCHAVTAQNKTGPGLAGVYGRQAGTAPNFHMAHMMKARIAEIDASHVVMLSQPDRVTAVIEDAQASVSSS
jgi:cytochrome c2